MRISKKLGLPENQRELNFVDIIIGKDLPLFIDPHYLSFQASDLAKEAIFCIQTFFDTLLLYLKNDDIDRARRHLTYIGEINEVHLGYSEGTSRGKGIGREYINKLIGSILDSKAMDEGLIENIEDSRIFIKGIGADLISDLCANVIKSVLLKYTEEQCDYWNIDMIDTPSGYFWNPNKRIWESKIVKRLHIDNEMYLLVPKEFVTYKSGYTPEQYKQHFVLNFLQDDHLQMNSSLVQVKRDKKGKIVRKWVTKKSIIEDLESSGINVSDKEWLTQFTLKHKEVLEKFRQEAKISSDLYNGDEITPESIELIVDSLIYDLKSIPTGKDHFTQYENAIKRISEFLFYPDLTNPKSQVDINNGRKRIDIVYTNISDKGIFHRLRVINDIPSNFIIMECKNYYKDIENPELDQLIGRFSNNRGKVGFIFCRNLNNPKLFLKRCQDTYRDNHAIIIHITDDDLIRLLEEYKSKFEGSYNSIISAMIDEVMFS